MAGLQLHKKQFQHQGMSTTAETPEPVETPVAEGMLTTVETLSTALMPT
jgi:hypothetical protein